MMTEPLPALTSCDTLVACAPGYRARPRTFPPAGLVSASPPESQGCLWKGGMIYNPFSVSISPESPSSREGTVGVVLAGFCSPAQRVSLLSIHDTFLKLCPPGKYYKEATLTTDQVSSLPALRVSPGWWVGWWWWGQCRWDLLRAESAGLSFLTGSGWGAGCGWDFS